MSDVEKLLQNKEQWMDIAVNNAFDHKFMKKFGGTQDKNVLVVRTVVIKTGYTEYDSRMQKSDVKAHGQWTCATFIVNSSDPRTDLCRMLLLPFEGVDRALPVHLDGFDAKKNLDFETE